MSVVRHALPRTCSVPRVPKSSKRIMQRMELLEGHALSCRVHARTASARGAATCELHGLLTQHCHLRARHLRLSIPAGEKATLNITSDYGYGQQGAGGVIPPNADLVFEVELLSIN